MRPEIKRALHSIPIGASSPLRACRNVGTEPLVVAEARGQYLHDIDGTRYVDFMYGFGPLILGHAPEAVSSALARQAAPAPSSARTACRRSSSPSASPRPPGTWSSCASSAAAPRP